MTEELKLFAFENGIPKPVFELYCMGKRGEVISAECVKKCFDENQDDIAARLVPKGCADYQSVFDLGFEHA